MRSRNGNRSFVFSSLALIAILSSLNADDYYIGYRLSAHNAYIVHESLWVSKAMQPCPHTKNISLTLVKNHPNESLESLLKRQQIPFLEFAAAEELRIKSNDTHTSYRTQTLNTLTIPTRCYAVEFNDDSVTITPTH